MAVIRKYIVVDLGILCRVTHPQRESGSFMFNDVARGGKKMNVTGREPEMVVLVETSC
jgi:hypothetical protein